MTDDTKKAEHEARKAAHMVPADWSADKHWPAKYSVHDNLWCGIFDTAEDLRASLVGLDTSTLASFIHPNTRRKIEKEFNAWLHAADAARKEIIDPARVTYQVTCDEARRVYEVAYGQAEKEHNERVNAACTAYDESDRSSEARIIRDSARHNSENAFRSIRAKARDTFYAAQEAARIIYDAACQAAQVPYDAAWTVAHETYRTGLIPLVKPELTDWRDVVRLDIVEKRSPVWVNSPFWYENGDIWRDHYVSVSDKDNALLAYVQSPEKGQRGIRTPIKPGRYLAQFFGHILNTKQIAMYAAWQTTGAKPNEYMDTDSYTVSLATEPDDIVRVYLRGPSSCMSHADTSYICGGHPTRVYGAGDLAIAYLHAADDKDKIYARALVWPAKKVISRIYPNADTTDNIDRHNTLKAHFESLGYESLYNNYRALNGARVLRIKANYGADHYVMPYLDAISRCDVLRHEDGTASDDYLILGNDGGFDAKTASGCAYIPAHAFAEGITSDEFDWTCERCGDGQYDDSLSCDVVVSMRSNARVNRTESWCEHCTDNHAFYCEGTEHTVSREHYDCSEVDGAQYSDRWLENNAVWSEYSESWYIGAISRMWDGMTVTDDEYEALKAEKEAADAEPAPAPAPAPDGSDEIELDEAA